MNPKQRQEIILQLLDTADEIDALTVMNVINTDTQTLTQDFRELLALGKIQQSSPGHYAKPFNTLRYLSKPISQRDKKSYNEEILSTYIPNISSLLGEEILQELSQHKETIRYTFRESLKLIEKIYTDLSYFSNKLAGGELDVLDTEILIKFGHAPKGIPFVHSQRILNYKEILDTLFQNRDDFEYSILDFQGVHKMLMYNKIADALRGELREYSIILTHTTYEPLSNPRILEKQFYLFITKLQNIKNPFEKSFFIFVFLPYILPFNQGNKELSRICMNIPFIQNGCPVVTFENISSEEYELAYRAYYELGDLSFLKKIFLSFFENPSENN